MTSSAAPISQLHQQMQHDMMMRGLLPRTRVQYRHVLTNQECCDGCIDDALRSLREIRAALLERKVDLMGERDPVLFHIIELLMVGIRQFLTFEQELSGGRQPRHDRRVEFYRDPDVRQTYMDALEVLRGHLSRCLGLVALVAGIQLPADGLAADFKGSWQADITPSPIDPDDQIGRVRRISTIWAWPTITAQPTASRSMEPMRQLISFTPITIPNTRPIWSGTPSHSILRMWQASRRLKSPWFIWAPMST